MRRRVQRYWDSHPLGTQFLPDRAAPQSTLEFEQLDQALDRWEYKGTLLDAVATRWPGGRLLEVGCGLGTDLVRLARRGLRVTGIDLAPAVAALARRHLEAYGLPGRVLVGDAEALSFPAGAFDVVYSSGVLQHLPDIGRAVAEIHRVLRPRGGCVCILYHRYSWFNALRHLGGVNVEFEDADPPIIHTYSRREVRQLFRRFTTVNVDARYYRPTPTPRRSPLARLYNHLFVPAMRRAPEALVRPFGWHLVISAFR
ncbi:MAG TPA: class I SAM-dependent methyltransferase [Candidatus Binatia bacterium]|nr:class I SAM-dependent methyltransferase [Candidatus Binatia bacterium]